MDADGRTAICGARVWKLVFLLRNSFFQSVPERLFELLHIVPGVVPFGQFGLDANACRSVGHDI